MKETGCFHWTGKQSIFKKYMKTRAYRDILEGMGQVVQEFSDKKLCHLQYNILAFNCSVTHFNWGVKIFQQQPQESCAGQASLPGPCQLCHHITWKNLANQNYASVLRKDAHSNCRNTALFAQLKVCFIGKQSETVVMEYFSFKKTVEFKNTKTLSYSTGGSRLCNFVCLFVCLYATLALNFRKHP